MGSLAPLSFLLACLVFVLCEGRLAEPDHPALVRVVIISSVFTLAIGMTAVVLEISVHTNALGLTK